MNEVKIPEGYKQTEVGVVPEDWETKNIGEDATLKARIGWQALTTNEYQSIGNHYLVTGTDFNAGEVQWDTCWHVDEWRYKQDSNIQLRINDVLVTKDGTIGKVGYVDKLPKPATLNSGVFVIRPKYTSFVPKYFFYVLTSSLFKEFIRNITAGSTITHLYQKDFVTFNFPLPPKKEQTAIATALSDVDNLIQSLEKLIAKKEAIKTGTMQQLLTGKTRLPEFATRDDGSAKGFKQTELGHIPEDWEVFKFNDLTNLITCGIAATPIYVPENLGVPFLSSTNIKNGKIQWKNFKYISHSLHDQLYKNNPPKKGDVLYSRVGTIGEAAVIEAEFEFSVYVSLTLIKPKKEKLNPYYLTQLLNSKPYKQKAKDEVYLGGGVGNLNVDVVRNYLIITPAYQEQTAIATILSDMDAEIQALQQRLEKTRDIKQGMMQQLLTGKVRLAH
jgi:type I restriction enzyme S subunit